MTQASFFFNLLFFFHFFQLMASLEGFCSKLEQEPLKK